MFPKALARRKTKTLKTKHTLVMHNKTPTELKNLCSASFLNSRNKNKIDNMKDITKKIRHNFQVCSP